MVQSIAREILKIITVATRIHKNTISKKAMNS